jgi:hypothetical protein
MKILDSTTIKSRIKQLEADLAAERERANELDALGDRLYDGVIRLGVEKDAALASVAKLREALKPFADLARHWTGDQLPLEPKFLLAEPLPVLFAVKALKETGGEDE